MTKSGGRMPTEQEFIHAAAINCKEVISDGPRDCVFHFVSFNATAGLVISSDTGSKERFSQATLREFERFASHIRKALCRKVALVEKSPFPVLGGEQTGQVCKCLCV